MEKTLTEEQVKAMGEEATELYNNCTTMLVEHKIWLRNMIHLIVKRDGSPLEPTMRMHLFTGVDQLRMEFVRVEPALKDDTGQVSLTMMYEYPDILIDTFRNPPAEWLVPDKLIEDFKSMTLLPGQEDRRAIQ